MDHTPSRRLRGDPTSQQKGSKRWRQRGARAPRFAPRQNVGPRAPRAEAAGETVPAACEGRKPRLRNPKAQVGRCHQASHITLLEQHHKLAAAFAKRPASWVVKTWYWSPPVHFEQAGRSQGRPQCRWDDFLSRFSAVYYNETWMTAARNSLSLPFFI